MFYLGISAASVQWGGNMSESDEAESSVAELAAELAVGRRFTNKTWRVV